MDRYITIFNEFWGNLILDFEPHKCDLLPRMTLTVFPVTRPTAFVLQIGFLWFSLNLTLWSKAMREFNKSNRNAIKE